MQETSQKARSVIHIIFLDVLCVCVPDVIILTLQSTINNIGTIGPEIQFLLNYFMFSSTYDIDILTYMFNINCVLLLLYYCLMPMHALWNVFII